MARCLRGRRTSGLVSEHRLTISINVDFFRLWTRPRKSGYIDCALHIGFEGSTVEKIGNDRRDELGLDPHLL